MSVFLSTTGPGGISLTEANGDFSTYFGPANLGTIEGSGSNNTIGTFVYENSNLANSYVGENYDCRGLPHGND